MKNKKETYSDEELEKMRDSAENIRDLALIDIGFYWNENRRTCFAE